MPKIDDAQTSSKPEGELSVREVLAFISTNDVLRTGADPHQRRCADQQPADRAQTAGATRASPQGGCREPHKWNEHRRQAENAPEIVRPEISESPEDREENDRRQRGDPDAQRQFCMTPHGEGLLREGAARRSARGASPENASRRDPTTRGSAGQSAVAWLRGQSVFQCRVGRVERAPPEILDKWWGLLRSTHPTDLRSFNN